MVSQPSTDEREFLPDPGRTLLTHGPAHAGTVVRDLLGAWSLCTSNDPLGMSGVRVN